MDPFFPPEIINNSCENYFSEQNSSSRVIYLAVITFLVATICLLPLVKVQVSTQSEGIVRSNFEDNPIVPVVTGEVVSCRIAENTIVNEADTLLIIASYGINQELNLLNFKQKEDSLLFFDLSRLLLGKNSGLATALCRQDFITYSGRLSEQKTQVLQAERDYILAERLFGKGITPRYDLEKISNQLTFEKSKYLSIQAQQRTTWQERLKEVTTNLANMASRIEQLRKEKMHYCLIAPISGTITGYTGIKAGNFVLPNQQIARISPDDELLAECYVTPFDIGLITKDMTVSFQFHAYNYNLWGVVNGVVNEISTNVISVNSSPYFRVKCKLSQSFLQLKNGTRGSIRKGMTLTGRFKVAERSLFQLLWDKADNWMNPKINKE